MPDLVEVPENDFDMESRLSLAKNFEFQVGTGSSSIECEIAEFRESKKTGQKLIKLGLELQSIEPTSVNNERCFSIAKLILTSNRLKMDPEKADMILFISRNLK